MKSTILFVLGSMLAALTFFMGCSGREPAKQKVVDPIAKDTVAHPAMLDHHAPLRRPDTIHQAKADSMGQALQDVYDRYVAGYTAHCTIDSSFKLAAAIYKLHVDHVCTFDSAIIIPKTYVTPYKLDSLVTHDFITYITLQKNGKKILERALSKKDFWLKDHPELSKYAVMLCPHLEIYLGEMIINYNISIPLTDVGISATANIDGKGAMSFHVGD